MSDLTRLVRRIDHKTESVFLRTDSIEIELMLRKSKGRRTKLLINAPRDVEVTISARRHS